MSFFQPDQQSPSCTVFDCILCDLQGSLQNRSEQTAKALCNSAEVKMQSHVRQHAATTIHHNASVLCRRSLRMLCNSWSMWAGTGILAGAKIVKFNGPLLI